MYGKPGPVPGVNAIGRRSVSPDKHLAGPPGWYLKGLSPTSLCPGVPIPEVLGRTYVRKLAQT